MKIVCLGILLYFCINRGSNGAAVRKQPAFATPVYSDAYLPAAMQVIFHAVSQLKNLQAEELENSLSSSTTTTAKTEVEATSPHAPGQHQPVFQDSPSTSTVSGASSNAEGSTASSASIEASPGTSVMLSVNDSTSSSPVTSDDSTSTSTLTSSSRTTTAPSYATQTSAAITDKNVEDAIAIKAPGIIDETTELIEAETPEENYETPEINHEVQEPGQEVQEPVERNEETIEKDGEYVNSYPTASPVEGDKSNDNSSEESDEKKNSSEESNEKDKSSEESKNKDDDSRSLGESQQEKLDSSEEEDEEIRFTLIGEKVSQVPRPSLSNYLRKTTKSPLRNSMQELASLYDALSKDARRQGFAKYSGYSDGVLKTLKSSAKGGIGRQITILLEKTMERKELTRDDAKSKTAWAVKSLRDPSTDLSRHLRPVIPLNYIL